MGIERVRHHELRMCSSRKGPRALRMHWPVPIPCRTWSTIHSLTFPVSSERDHVLGHVLAPSTTPRKHVDRPRSSRLELTQLGPQPPLTPRHPVLSPLQPQQPCSLLTHHARSHHTTSVQTQALLWLVLPLLLPFPFPSEPKFRIQRSLL